MVLRVVAAAVVLVSVGMAQGVGAGAGLGQGQSGSESAELRTELKKLAGVAQMLRDDLPSFTCQETAKSQLLKKNKVKQQVQIVGEVRVQRVEERRLQEELKIAQVNGKPFAGGSVKAPVMVQGGFGESLFFFLPEIQPCFDFTLTGARLEFATRPGMLGQPGCDVAGTLRGFALLDGEGNIVHMEREVPPEIASQFHLVDANTIDFVYMELGGRAYPLSAKMTADVRGDGEVKHFEAAYSGCHLFTATVTILPGAAPVTEPAPDGAPHR
jgi:hypothetical protein